jgi:hypothetical protein
MRREKSHRMILRKKNKATLARTYFAGSQQLDFTVRMNARIFRWSWTGSKM